MVVYSYLIEHDFGLAPNPFGKYCTLAVCKPKIRRSQQLQLGDWVVGTGSKALENSTGRKLRGRIIYAFEVEEKLSFDQYWSDARFQYKKPVMNGSLVAMYGDNFYHSDENGTWNQEPSAHCNIDNTTHHEHLSIDVGGKNVLVGTNFYYFGDSAPKLRDDLLDICHTGIGEKKIVGEKAMQLIDWLQNNFRPGIHGDPLNWIKNSQLALFNNSAIQT